MFKKILIIEDIDSISLGIMSLLEKRTSADIKATKYCDEAFLKIKKAIFEKEPYDLIITDLSFKEDHREAKITSGEDLIKAVRQEQPNIKVIVYSIEDRPYKIKSLFDNLSINAFVIKDRESTFKLVEAMEVIYNSDSQYISPLVSQTLKDDTLFEIEDYDIELIMCLSRGLTQDEISVLFRKQDKSPSSTSSIEKRINKLKIFFKAKNTIHLIAISKDMGII